jgi:myosin heavy subunit
MWSLKKMREKYAKKPGGDAKSAEQNELDQTYRGQVWVPHDEKVWAIATTVEERETTLMVKVPGDDDGPKEVARKNVHQFDPSHYLDLDDASKMNGMHEAPLLDLLLRRFKQDKIYTNMADVLVSINPYKRIPLLYEIPLLQMQDDSDDEFEESDGEEDAAAGSEGSSAMDRRPDAIKKKLDKPHVHSVADRAFRYMTEPGREYAHGKVRSTNQSIIITGESGGT